MIKETFLTLCFSIGLFASCLNKKFKQSLNYKHPAITLADKIDSIVVSKMNQYNIPGLSQWMISFIDKLDSEKEPFLLHSMIAESTNTSKFIGLGFQLYSVDGKKAIGHYGGDIGFRSFLVVMPDENGPGSFG